MTLPGQSDRALSARADGGGQLTVDEVIASARADRTAEAVDELERAAVALRDAELARAQALSERDSAIVAAARAGVSVRQLAALAGMGKTQASEIARYGVSNWR